MNGGELCLIDGTEDGLANNMWDGALNGSLVGKEFRLSDGNVASDGVLEGSLDGQSDGSPSSQELAYLLGVSLDPELGKAEGPPDGCTLVVTLRELLRMLLGLEDIEFDEVFQGSLNE